jgi:membrane protein DedA with SNARE-associated domain
LEDIIARLQSLDPLLVYGLVFAIAFVENLFPPSPSDIMIATAGSLVGLGRIGFLPTLLFATAGSTAGFVLMYGIGDWFGVHILERGKLKFIPVEAVRKVEGWFVKYGYWIIVANRFLAGTRAVVSFFAGMSELKFLPTTILCFVSALCWNAILVGSGYLVGHNLQKIGFYLSTYSQFVTALIILVVIILAVRYFTRRNGAKTS